MSKEKLKIDESIKIIESRLRLSGMNVESNKRTDAQNKIYILRYLINFLMVNTLVIASIVWCVKGIADGINIAEITRGGPAGMVFCLLADIKSVAFLMYGNSVNELMDALRNLENEENDRERPDEINEIIKSEIGFLNNILKIYKPAMGISSTMFSALPVLTFVFNYFGNHEQELLLPMHVVLPFDQFDIRFWPFAYLHQIWAVTIIGYQVVAADCMFFIFCTYLKICFKIVGHDFEKIIENSDTNSKFYATVEFKNRLASLVKRHQHILKAVTILEKIFAASNLFNFVSSALVICLNAFNITSVSSGNVDLDDNILLTIVFVFFGAFNAVQIFSVCYFADLLIKQSMQVSDAVYKCNWYLAEKPLVKVLQIVHQRAQNPCKITAYGYADVNLLSYTKIMKTAWSYFTLLNTVYSGAEN